MELSQSELVARVLQWIHQNRLDKDSATIEVTEDTDLLATGLLDSFGFVELIAFVEKENGSRIDLADIDPSEFVVVRGLCRAAMRNGN